MVKFLFCIWLGSISLGLQPKRVPHPLYVSITDLEWNTKEHSIEITSKIFLDDFEAILKKNYKTKVDLYAPQNEITRLMMLDYFKKNMVITVNDKPVSFTMIGYEKQKEACWCYLEISNITAVNKIACSNALLYDYTDKQMNLMHVTVGGNKKSTKLLYPEKQASFSF